MTTIIGYAYMSDTHCVDCAKQDATFSGFRDLFTDEVTETTTLQVNNYHANAHGLASSPALNTDEHGLHVNLQDADGNLIHPIFSTDEREITGCGDCGVEV
jgi:hypothetical protein